MRMLAVVARFASKINHYIRAMMKKTILYLAHAALRWILLVFGGWCGAALAADGVPRSALANAHIGVAVLVAGIFVAAFLLALTLLVWVLQNSEVPRGHPSTFRPTHVRGM